MSRLLYRITAIVTLCTLTLLASCASTGKDSVGSLRSDPLTPGILDEQRVQRLPAEKLYKSAREALDSSDYTTAIQLYDRLDAQFPFTEFATQGKLEAIYAHYRAYQPELALSAADRFMRANPRHKNLDYVLYLRGLVNFDRGASDLLDALDIDSSTRDPINARRAFEDFGLLLQRFPSSIYAADARQRMIYLRERIGQNELAIARFYATRGAWVAASRRAQDVITKFQGSSLMPEALALLEQCYRELKLDDRADNIRAIAKASFADAASAPAMPSATPAPPPATVETATEPAPAATPAVRAKPQATPEPKPEPTPAATPAPVTSSTPEPAAAATSEHTRATDKVRPVLEPVIPDWLRGDAEPAPAPAATPAPSPQPSSGRSGSRRR